MITYEVEGRFPLNTSVAILTFSKDQKVSEIIANLGYTYEDEATSDTRVVYPMQVGEYLVWPCKRDSSSVITVGLYAPYNAVYEFIEIDMPRGMEDEFAWKDPSLDPISAREHKYEEKLKIGFSQEVTADEIKDYLKIAGRDCNYDIPANPTKFIWADRVNNPAFSDITATYTAECDMLEVTVPNDCKVNTIQWTAAEPIPIEQMYHKVEHRPFFPKTAFSAVVDHNGNSLSQAVGSINAELAQHDHDIDNLQKAIGGKVDFDDFLKHIKVNTLPTPTTSEDADKTIYHLTVASNGYVPGYYIFTGMSDDITPKPKYVRIDNSIEDVESPEANKYYARHKNTVTGSMEWKPVEGGGGSTDAVVDVIVNGETVVDPDTKVASFDCARLSILTQDEYDALLVKEPNTFYTIKKTDALGKAYISKIYVGELEVGSSASMLGHFILGTDVLG